MAEEEHLEREPARAWEAERLVVPEEWTRILELARERWPGLDSRDVYTWDGLAERLAGHLELPPDEIQGEIAGFRDGLPAGVMETANAQEVATGGVVIGDVSGGIHGSLIAGRDIVAQLPGEVGTDDEWD
jgi:hypothetical protein